MPLKLSRARAPANSPHETQTTPPEEIIKKLRKAATLLASGQSVDAVCKKLEVSTPTYHRERQEYGGAKEETVKRLKALEKENTQIKRLVANQALDLSILKEVAEVAEWNETAKGAAPLPEGQHWRVLATW